MSAPVRIPDSEYPDRVRRAQALLADTDLDVLLVNSNEADFANVRYFSKYWPIFEIAGVAIPREGEPTLICGPESEAFAQDRGCIGRVRKMTEYRESADPAYPGVKVSTFRDVFGEMGVADPKKIGVAGYLVTTMPVHDGLRKSFPNAEIVPADKITVALRSVKTEAELACLREGFRISQAAMKSVMEKIRPGMTELQAVGIAQEALYSAGAEYESHPQYVLSGKGTSHAISRPTHRVMQEGDLVQLCIGGRVDGYSPSVGRPVCLGKMSPRMKELVEFGLEAQRKTLEWMKAGVPASEVAKKYEQYFRDRGYGDNFLYGPCHGLGMIEVEPPWMETTSEYPLQENMTFQVDTFVQDKAFGLRWENGVRVAADGVEMLSDVEMRVLEL